MSCRVFDTVDATECVQRPFGVAPSAPLIVSPSTQRSS